MNLLEYELKYERATYFLSGYLHADCICEHGSSENIVASFINNEELENIISVADDFVYILEQKIGEEELEELLIGLGAGYYLWRSDNLDPSKWVRKLVDIFYEKSYC